MEPHFNKGCSSEYPVTWKPFSIAEAVSCIGVILTINFSLSNSFDNSFASRIVCEVTGKFRVYFLPTGIGNSSANREICASDKLLESNSSFLCSSSVELIEKYCFHSSSIIFHMIINIINTTSHTILQSCLFLVIRNLLASDQLEKALTTR